ncbi:hypothetical protein L7F22_069080 [Adiantum nelumboides]|nr:hypothetical protein [Adiantum nelumboides]
MGDRGGEEKEYMSKRCSVMLTLIEHRKLPLLPRISALQSEWQRLKNLHGTRMAQVNKIRDQLEAYRPLLGSFVASLPALEAESPASSKFESVPVSYINTLNASLASCANEVQSRRKELDANVQAILQLWSELCYPPDVQPQANGSASFDSLVLRHLRLQPLWAEVEMVDEEGNPIEAADGFETEYEFRGEFAPVETLDGDEGESAPSSGGASVPDSTPTRSSGSHAALGPAPRLIAAHELAPLKENLNLVKAKRQHLEDEKTRREEQIQALYDELVELWMKFDVGEEEIGRLCPEQTAALLPRSSRPTSRSCSRCASSKSQHMALFISKVRQSIADLWDEIRMSPEERTQDFEQFFYDLDDGSGQIDAGVEPSDELLRLHEQHVEVLRREAELKRVPLALVKRYRDLLDEGKALEESAKDQTRLMGRGARGDPGRLLREEKTRKRLKMLKPRTLLNALVVEHAEANPRINVHYRHKLKSINFHARCRRRDEDEDEDEDKVQLQFAVSDKDERKGIYTADVVFGCDGMHSIVRSEMAKAVRMDFSQSYIDNSYVELHIPAGPDGDFALDPNHLHIWPRHDFMLIALANQDKSFTSTLFAPSKVFDENLSSAKGISDFFDEHFADAVDLLGREALIRDISQRRPSPLATIRCRPYHYKSRAILLGDASHAMVPFYGQGLNCGLEDVRVMLDLIDKHSGQTASVDLSTGTDISFGPHSRVDSGVHVTGQNAKATAASASTKAKAKQRAVALQQAFDAYTSSRHNDLVAISELALDNYREMCSRVVSTPYLVRKRVDNMLMKPDNELRESVVAVCGPTFSSGPLCCTADQVESLRQNVDQAEALVSGCPACRNNFRNLFCSMTCGGDQSQYLDVVETQKSSTPGADGDVAVKTINYWVGEEFRQGLYDNCKNVKFGPGNAFAMDLLGGGAKDADAFLKYMGDVKPLVGSPFQINFPHANTSLIVSRSNSEPLPFNPTPRQCGDPDLLSRCACTDCPEVCATLPYVAPPVHHETCTVSLPFGGGMWISCFGLFVAVMYALGLVIMLTGYGIGLRHNLGRRKRAAIGIATAASACGAREAANERVRLSSEEQDDRHSGPRSYKLNVWLSSFFYSPGSEARHRKMYFDEHFGPFYRTQQIFVMDKTAAALAKTMKPTAGDEWQQRLVEEASPVLNWERLQWWADVEAEIRTLKSPKGFTLDDVCFAPAGPNGPCVVQSIMGYFGDSLQGLNEGNWKDALDCCASSPAECLPAFGQPLKRNIILGGVPETIVSGDAGDTSAEGKASDARSLVTTWVVTNSLNETEVARAQDWEVALEKLLFSIAGIDEEEEEEHPLGTRRRELGLEMWLSTRAACSRSWPGPAAPTSSLSCCLTSSCSSTLPSPWEGAAPAHQQAREATASQLHVVHQVTIIDRVWRSHTLVSSLSISGLYGCAPALVVSPIVCQFQVRLGLFGIVVVIAAVSSAVGLFSAVGVKVTLVIVEVLPSSSLPSVWTTSSCLQTRWTGRMLWRARPIRMQPAQATREALRHWPRLGSPPPTIAAPTKRASRMATKPVPEEQASHSARPTTSTHRTSGKDTVQSGAEHPAQCLCPSGSLSPWSDHSHASCPPFRPLRSGEHGICRGSPVHRLCRCHGPRCRSYGSREDRLLALPEDTGSLPIQHFWRWHRRGIIDRLRQRRSRHASGPRQRRFLGRFVRRHYAPWLIKPSVKKFILVVFAALFAVSLVSVRHVEMGLDQRLALPEGSYLRDYFDVAQEPHDQDCPLGGQAAYSAALSIQDGRVTSSHFRTFHTPLRSQADFIDALASTERMSKDIIAAASTSENGKIDVFAYSVFSPFFDQYLYLDRLALQLLGGSLVAIIAVTTLLLGSLWTALIVAACVSNAVLCVAASMAYLGIGLNALTLVNLAVCSAICVEFCAHVARAFMRASSSASGGGGAAGFSTLHNPSSSVSWAQKERDERAWAALVDVGPSVISGITGTKLVGISVLFWAHSDILKLYYASLWFVLIITGALHGLVLLPVALSLFGGQAMPARDDEAEVSRRLRRAQDSAEFRPFGADAEEDDSEEEYY